MTDELSRVVARTEPSGRPNPASWSSETGIVAPRTLVTIAHGTRTTVGNDNAVELTRRAGEQLGVPAVASYVELCTPLFEDVVATTDGPLVAVPLLLSTGVHVRRDLPEAVAATGRTDVALGPQLGPHPLIARAQADRLREAGATPGQPVVLVAAGSSDPAALDDLDGAVAALADEWGAPVRLATLTGLGPRPHSVVRAGDAVSPYLLATGHFHRKARSESFEAGASVVADVIGPHDAVVELVVERARALAPDGCRTAS